MISVAVFPGRSGGSAPKQHELKGFEKIFDALLQPDLTHQYERHKAAMLQRHHGDRTKLPAPVHWRGLKIGPEQSFASSKNNFKEN